MKTRVFESFCWVDSLWAGARCSYPWSQVELGELYLAPSMRTSGSSSERIYSAKTVQKSFASMKNPIFVWDGWILFSKYELDTVELVEFYLAPSMRTSDSSSKGIHSAKAVKKPFSSRKLRFLCEMIGSYGRNTDWMLESSSISTWLRRFEHLALAWNGSIRESIESWPKISYVLQFQNAVRCVKSIPSARFLPQYHLRRNALWLTHTNHSSAPSSFLETRSWLRSWKRTSSFSYFPINEKHSRYH